MATRLEGNVVYAAGLVQGIVLVTFPAASTIFTDPASTACPTRSTARCSCRRWSPRSPRRCSARGWRDGSAASACTCSGCWPTWSSMVLLARQRAWSWANDSLAYGAAARGHGLPRRRIRAHRPVAEHVHGGVPPRPRRPTRCWSSTPCSGSAPRWRRCSSRSSSASASGGVCRCSSVVLLVALIARQPSPPAADRSARAASAGRATGRRSPARFWMFAAFAVLYGICETMNGNWAAARHDQRTRRLRRPWRRSRSRRSGRWSRSGGCCSRRSSAAFPTRRTYHLLPFVLAAALARDRRAAGGRPVARRRRVRPRRAWAARRSCRSRSASARSSSSRCRPSVAGGVIAVLPGRLRASRPSGPDRCRTPESSLLHAVRGRRRSPPWSMGLLSFVIATRPGEVAEHTHAAPPLPSDGHEA